MIQKFKLILLYFGKKVENEFLRALNYEKYPTQFAFDAYSGLNIWGRYLTRGDEKVFVRVWTVQAKECLKEIKILTRFLIDSIGIIIFVEKNHVEEFQEFWDDNYTNYPVLIISDFELEPPLIERNDNLKQIKLENLDDHGQIGEIIENEIFEIKDIEVKYVCSECKKELPLIPDGNFRYCFCGKAGINHSESFTRLMGDTLELRKRI